MPFDQKDRATLDAFRDATLSQVGELVTQKLDANQGELKALVSEYDAKLPERIQKGIAEVFDGDSPAEIAERFKTFRQSTQVALDDLGKRVGEARQQNWRDSDGRVRVQSGRYAGVPLDIAQTALTVAQAKATFVGKTIEMDELQKSLDETSVTQDMAERHFAAIRREMPVREIKGVRKGYGLDPVVQRMEDIALGRRNPDMPEAYGEYRIQAVTTTTAGAPNLTTPILDGTLWADMMLMPGVYQRLPIVNMGAPTHYISNIDDVLVDALDYQGTVGASAGEIVAQADTDPNFERATLTARTIRLASSISQDELEDSVINLAVEIRNTMQRAGQYGLDNFVLNSDSSTTAPGADGSTANGNINAANAHPNALTRLGANGVRKYAIGNSVDASDASPSPTLISQARALLRDAGVTPGDFFYVMPSNTYYAALINDEFRRYDAAAQLATILTGEMRMALGTAIEVSRSMPPQVAESGRIGTTATNNDKGHILLVVPQLWRLGVYVPFQLMSAMGQGGTPAAPARSSINPPGLNFLLRGRYDVQHRATAGTYRHTRPASLLRNIDVGERLVD